MVNNMKSKHIYLNLSFIDLPITALTSILHRVTGIILFFFSPFILYFFYLSMESSSSFIIAKSLFSHIYIKILFKLFLLTLIYHFFNGIKHILMDIGYFENKITARNISLIVLFLTFIFIFLSFFL